MTSPRLWLSMICAVAILLATALPVLAQQPTATGAIGYFPAWITVDALRGQRYEAGVVLINTTAVPRSVTFETEGGIEAWVSFAGRDAPEMSIDQVELPPNDRTALLVYFDIPPETPNGPYEGVIRYHSVGSRGGAGGDESASGVQLTLEQQITIDVTGVQRLEIRVPDLFARDVEVGQMLNIEAAVDNRSNVSVTPVMLVDIETSAKVPIASLESRMAPFKPSENRIDVAAEWDTSGQAPGDYVAHYDLRVQGRSVKAGELHFKLLPTGTLTRSGEIRGITFHGELTKGSTARADVAFANTGRSVARARFVGDLYRNGQFVGEVTSREELLARSGEEIVLHAFIPLHENGEYELRGRVNFEGAVTEEYRAVFRTAAGAFALPMALIGGAAAAVGVALMGLVIWRRDTGVAVIRRMVLRARRSSAPPAA